MSIIDANGRRFHYVLDRTPVHRAEGFVRLVGDRGPLLDAEVTIDAPDCTVKATADGYYAFVATGRANVSGPVRIVIRAPGHYARNATLVLDRTSPDLGELYVPSRQTRVVGTVMHEDGQDAGDLSVNISTLLATDGFATYLRTPLAQDYPAGTAVAARSYSASGTVLRLARIARPLFRSLDPADPAQWLPSMVVAYGPDHARACLHVQSTHAAGAPIVPLAAPVVRTTPDWVELLTPSGSAASRRLVRRARSGDGVVWLDAPVSSGALEIGVERFKVGVVTIDQRSFVLDGVPAAIDITAVDNARPGPVALAEIRGFGEPEQRVSMTLDSQ